MSDGINDAYRDVLAACRDSPTANRRPCTLHTAENKVFIQMHAAPV